MKSHGWNSLAVGVGSVFGTFFRYGINLLFLHTVLPVATLIENLVGSLLLGFLTGWISQRTMFEWLRNGLGVGLLGGFTTMSTFASDAFFLFGSPAGMIVYVVSSIACGMMLAWLGFFFGERAGLKANRNVVVKE